MTRWWSKFEVMVTIARNFPSVERYIAEMDQEGICISIIKRLKATILDPDLRCKLLTELAVTLDAMTIFVKATYFMEGDGFIVLELYQRLNSIISFVESNNSLPNVDAVINRELESTDIINKASVTTSLRTHARNCYLPAFQYFLDRIRGDSDVHIRLGRCAEVFDPRKAALFSSETISERLRNLKEFVLFSNHVSDLVSELPMYKASTTDIDQSLNPWMIWKIQSSRGILRTWVTCLLILLLIQPASGAIERVFSELREFGDSQHRLLEDAVEST